MVKNLEAQKKELATHSEGVEEEVEVLKLEVRERDRILLNNQEELNSLNEQLAEVRGQRSNVVEVMFVNTELSSFFPANDFLFIFLENFQ